MRAVSPNTPQSYSVYGEEPGSRRYSVWSVNRLRSFMGTPAEACPICLMYLVYLM